ncbi:hypothetical protein HPB49_002925 [Dermacentor silvarum]|uniref:Uncharacterized protein n=1 Tax=Dermacentor silvarum TaxID=543639 RepID=A0ACB8CP72_DERSI|nr:hypothetical protein HPB49_002925 [Dermacentor silvarum]
MSMTDIRMEVEDFAGSKENDEEDLGWQVVTSRRSRTTKKVVDDKSAVPRSQQEHGSAAGGGRGSVIGAIKNRIVKASRMPQLPEEHSKIIIRPRGGLNLNKVSTTAIGAAVIEASGLTAEQAREDVVCPNFTQNIVVVSTPKPEHAFNAIKSFKIVETEYEVNAYETAPHATYKGVIRRMDIRDTQAIITRNIVHDLNALALAAKRIKTSGSVIVLFDGLKVPNFVRYGSTLVRCYLFRKQFDVCYTCGRVGHRSDVCPTPDFVQCRGCGIVNPGEAHVCVPQCKFCEGDHPTGDKSCKQRFQIPYVVRLRRRERNRSRSITRAPLEELQPVPHHHPSTRGRSRSRSRTRFRRRSQSRERSRSKSREAQVRFEERGSAPGGKKTPETAWADKVIGTVRVAGDVTAAVAGSNDARIEQLIKEVTSLRKANEELTRQVVELRKKAQQNHASVAIARPVSQSNDPGEEDSSPAPKKRAVSSEDGSVFSALNEIKEAIKAIRETTEKTNFKVDKLWKWRLTAEKRLRKIEARGDGDDDEYLPSEVESVKSLPGTSGAITKRTLTGNRKADSSNNHGQ